MMCKTCSGTRFVIKQERRKWGSGKNACYMGLQTTGISHLCDDCQGTGLALDPAYSPDCPHCNGRGERAVMDSFGHYDGTEDCSCSAPVTRQNVVERVYLGEKVA